jgi:hypothetical protein
MTLYNFIKYLYNYTQNLNLLHNFQLTVPLLGDWDLKKWVPHTQTTFFLNLTTNNSVSLLADVYSVKRYGSVSRYFQLNPLYHYIVILHKQNEQISIFSFF